MINKIKSEWTNIQNFIKDSYELSDVSYTTWILPLIPNKITNDENGNKTLELIIPDAPVADFLKKKYSIYIRAAIEEVTGIRCDLSYVTPDQLSESKTTQKSLIEKGTTSVDQKTLYESNLVPEFTFSNFIVGKNNSFAHAASLAVAETPGEIYNPLFLYGGAGLGKTHLMHAIAHFILEKNPKSKVLYVRSEDFTFELIDAIRKNSIPEFRNKYRNNDVLMIDDIQFIIGKDASQEEFFWTFNTLFEAKKQIIIASDKPPKEFTTLEERLRSRLESNLVVEILKPDYETRVAILRKKEERLECNIDDEVIKYIATNVKDSIRELEGALSKVTAMHRLNGLEVDLELAKSVLKDTISPQEAPLITPELIIKTVCEHYNISESDLTGSKRNKELVYPRHISMYLIRQLTNTSLDAIGKYLGNRDHTTIIHGVEKISTELLINEELVKNIDILKKKMSAGY